MNGTTAIRDARNALGLCGKTQKKSVVSLILKSDQSGLISGLVKILLSMCIFLLMFPFRYFLFFEVTRKLQDMVLLSSTPPCEVVGVEHSFL